MEFMSNGHPKRKKKDAEIPIHSGDEKFELNSSRILATVLMD